LTGWLWIGEIHGCHYAIDEEYVLWRLLPDPVVKFRGEALTGLRVALQGDGSQSVEEAIKATVNLQTHRSLHETFVKVLTVEPLYPHEVKGLEEAVGRWIKAQLIPAVVQVQSPTGGSQSDA